MPIQCLIRANNDKAYKDVRKGMIFNIKDTPCTWGDKERLPDWIICEITDATKAQALNFLTPWKNDFKYVVSTITIDESPHKQIVLSVNPKIIEVLGKAITLKLRLFIVKRWAGTIVTHTDSSVTFNVPGDTDLTKMKTEFYEGFREVVGKRVNIFPESDVDIAIANDGFMSITKAQALNRIIDRRI